MANPCGTGAGTVRPGFAPAITLLGAAIEGAIGEVVAGPIGAVIGAVLGGRTFDLNAVCGAVRPEDPGLNPQDILDAINVYNPAVMIPAVLKIEQWFMNFMWCKWCACANGQVCVEGTIIPPPPVSQNPGLPPGTSSAPCWDAATSFTHQTASSSDFVDLANDLLPNTATIPVTPAFTGGPTVARQIPTGAQQIFITTSRVTGPSNQNVLVNILGYNSSGLANYNQTAYDGPPLPGPFVFAVVPPSGMIAWQLVADQGGIGTTWGATVELAFACQGQPPIGVNVPCCPPDPLLDFKLNQIYGLETAIYNALQAQPKHWVDGVRHSNLSGNGSFAINQTAIGVRVEVTVQPPNPIILPGTPNFFWDLGFITPIAVGSPLRGNRLVFLSESFQLPRFTDSIGYTLLNGTHVDIVELLPSFT